MFQIKPKTLNFWYKEILSNYHSDVEQKKFASQTVDEVNLDTGEVIKENVIHILKPDNVGTKMCIDEKMIGKRYCTILSNSETGKIALLIESMKPNIIRESLNALGKETINKVQQICSDMSPMYKKICTEIFPQATLSVDKFHVIKQILDVLQALSLVLK